MEMQARKRSPASRSDEEAEVKSARARTLDDDVEEFFAIIRRMRAASMLPGSDHSNRPNPSFQAEDAADGGCRGRRQVQSMSGRDQEEVEAGEDSGIPAKLSLNIGACGGGTRKMSVKRRAGGSESESVDPRRCISGGSY